MSTVHNTGARLWAWVRGHALLLVAIALALGLVVTIFVTTFRLYDDRQAQFAALEELARENDRQNVIQCEAINGANTTLRELLDVSISRRPPGTLTAEDRQLAIDTYRRLPYIDCVTGARTDFAPPFPPTG